MPLPYDGVTLHVRLSSARPGEAANRGMTVEEANETLQRHLRAQLERKYPGATIEIEIGGDRPEADVSGMEDLRRSRLVKYDVEKTGLALKWAFSTLGQGLPAG